MKSLKLTVPLLALLLAQLAAAQDYNSREFQNQWQIGIGLGELPMDGSFKPSITFGYHLKDKLYAGVIYQFKDKIQRNESSFNAKSSGLDGLLHSSETVSQRFLLHLRYTPFRRGPYLSGGLVFNGEDREIMTFDARSRTLSDETYDGNILIQQSRPAGWGIALGLGYQYDFRNGLSVGFEWTPAWGQYPEPFYLFGGTADLSEPALRDLESKMDEGFGSSVTNMYKVFHLGLAYRFQ